MVQEYMIGPEGLPDDRNMPPRLPPRPPVRPSTPASVATPVPAPVAGHLVTSPVAGPERTVDTTHPAFEAWLSEAVTATALEWPALPPVTDRRGRTVTSRDILRALVFTVSGGMHRAGGALTVTADGGMGFLGLPPADPGRPGIDPADPLQNLTAGASRFGAGAKALSAMDRAPGDPVDHLLTAVCAFQSGPSPDAPGWADLVRSRAPEHLPDLLFGLRFKMFLGLPLSSAEQRAVAWAEHLAPYRVAELAESRFALCRAGSR